MTQHDIVLHQVEGRILRYLNRIKTQYQTPLYNAVGRGAEPDEFTSICDRLVEKGILKRSVGQRDGVILQWVE